MAGRPSAPGLFEQGSRRQVDRHDMIRIFEAKAAKIVARYMEDNENLAQDLRDCLVELPENRF